MSQTVREIATRIQAQWWEGWDVSDLSDSDVAGIRQLAAHVLASTEPAPHQKCSFCGQEFTCRHEENGRFLCDCHDDLYGHIQVEHPPAIAASTEPLEDECLQVIDRRNHSHQDIQPVEVDDLIQEIRRLQAELKTRSAALERSERERAICYGNEGALIAEKIDLRAQLQAAGQEREKSERWEIGFRNIVTALAGPRVPFEISNIVESVERLQGAQQSLKQTQLERDNYASQLTLSTKWLCERGREIKRHLRFHEGIAKECLKVGTDFGVGRAYGVSELAMDIRCSLATPAVTPPASVEDGKVCGENQFHGTTKIVPPAQEHPDTARLDDVIRRATAPMQGVTFYRKITTGKWQYQERDEEGYMGICGEGETQRDAIDNAARTAPEAQR